MASLREAKALVFCDSVSTELRNMERRVDILRDELKKISGMASAPAKDQRVTELTENLIQLTDGIGEKLNIMAKECSVDYRHLSD